MDFGVHLPLIALGDHDWSLDGLLEYTHVAASLGFQAIAVNDHLVFPKPKLDGLIALSAVLACSGRMTLATAVALPTVRGPLQLAKALAAIDVISGGRVLVGVGPGGRAEDYRSVNIPFEERWQRFDEAVQALRAMLGKNTSPFRGRFYSTEGISLEPYPIQKPAPPIWIGSWGSEAGLRRTARLGDGWMASALGTAPASFADAWSRLQVYLGQVGKDPKDFPNAVATLFFFVSEDKAVTDRIFQRILSPFLGRPASELRDNFPIGTVQECASKLLAYQAAGAQRLFLWPLGERLKQLGIFRDRIEPLM